MSTGATSYSVFRGTTAGGESTTAVKTGLTVTTYTDTGRAAATTYFYYVKAVNGSGSSVASNEASAITQCAAPAGLAATGGTAQVGLTWTPTTGAASYSVFRGTTAGGESPTPIKTGVTGTSVADTGLSPGATYYYKIAAINASGAGPNSSEVHGLTVCAAPTGLTAAAGGPTQVILNWAPTTGAASYSVFRGTTPGGESTTAVKTGATGTTYTNTALTAGTTYYYEIKAVNPTGSSGYSNEASAITITVAPTTLAATATNLQIALTWTGPIGAATYSVYRGTAAGGESATAIATGLTSAAYTDPGLTAGTKFYYKVAAVNAGERVQTQTKQAPRPSRGRPQA